MTSYVRLLTIVVFAYMAFSCGTYQDIYSDVDRRIDFSSYRTFAWAPDSGMALPQKEFEGTPYDNDIVRNNAKNYITHCLGHRGYLVDVDSPDLILQLVLLNEKREKIVTYSSRPYPPYYFHSPYYFPYYYPYYRYYTWYGWGYYPPGWDERLTTYNRYFVRGTITVNVYDRQLQRLIWTGSAEGDIYDPSYIRYDVHPAIDRIMRRFPVKPLHRKELRNDFKIRERVVFWKPRGEIGKPGAP